MKVKPDAVGSKKQLEPVIDASLIDLGGLSEKEFPSSGNFRVWIAPEAHDVVWKHARESVTAVRTGEVIVEVGGVLVGNVYKDKDGPYLEVAGAIAGEHTRNQGTQMTFTPETWAQVNKVKDERYSDTKVVGWYHTHPRFGIFLSDMDKFIHKHHFPQPWTTALVVDPVQETEGFFVWSNGEPRPTAEYWVGSDRRTRTVVAKVASPEPVLETPQVMSDQSGTAVSRATFALATVLGFLALLFVAGYVYMREVGHSETEKLVMALLELQKNELRNTVGSVRGLNEALEKLQKETSGRDNEIQVKLQGVVSGLEKATAIAEDLQVRLATQQLTLDHLVSGSTPEPVRPPAEVRKK